MKNKNIRKMAATLAVIEALTLSGCKSKNVEVINTNSLKQIISLSDTIVDSQGYTHPTKVNLNENEYTTIPENENVYDINFGCRVYNKNGKDIGEITEYVRVIALETNGEYTRISINNKEYYVESTKLMKVPTINKGQYTVITENKEMVCDDWVNIYDNNGKYIGYDWGNSECMAVASNGEFTLVTFENGFSGYIESSKLNPKYVHVNAHAYIRQGTIIYGDKELTRQIGTIENDHITYVHMDDGNYAYVGNEYYKEVYYVKSSDLEYTEDFTEVNNQAYITSSIPMYADKEFTILIDTLEPYSPLSVYIESKTGDWANVYDHNHNLTGFIKKGTYTFMDNNFIDVDLGEQKIHLYEDGITHMWGYIRSGKDSTPTHEGIFDIDWKAKDWEFTTYKGSYADYWIPYNEYGEGIHDLRGDDVDNYGNSAYHNYGSHGCVRVRSSISGYIYNDDEHFGVGTLVLVHK